MKNNPNSGIDITYLAESFAEQGIDAGIFEELDYSKIPNAENINAKISEIDFKEIINNLTSYALDSYDELINYLKGKVDNRYAKLFNC